MSMKITSGLYSCAAFSAPVALVRLARLLPEELQHHRQRLRGVEVVVHDEDALAGAGGGLRGRLPVRLHVLGCHVTSHRAAAAGR